MQISTSKTRISVSRPLAAVAAISSLMLAIPQSASAAPLWPDSPVTPTGKISFYLFILVFAAGVIGLIGYVNTLREASRSEVDVDAPAPTEGTAKSALVAGLIVFVILVAAGGYGFAKSTKAERSTTQIKGETQFFKATTFSQPGLRVAHVVKAPSGPVYSIRVNAQQFLWRYQYTNLPGAVWNNYAYDELILPVGITVMLDFTSSDVEAAWWVPALGGSISAIPGYDNKVWLRADEVGIFKGAGTVVNGTNYANMRTTVRVVHPAVFARLVLRNQMGIDDAMERLGRADVSGEEELLEQGGEVELKVDGQDADAAANGGDEW